MTGLFCRYKAMWIKSTSYDISIKFNFEYFFLTCLYRGQSSKKCFSSSTVFLQWKQNLFFLGMVGLQYLPVSTYTTDVHLFLFSIR